MRIKRFSLLFSTFCIFSFKSLAGNMLNLSVYIPINIDEKKIIVLIENGLEQKIISPIFKNKRCIISEEVYSQLASVTLSYPAKNDVLLGITLLVSHTKKAVIRFETVKDRIANKFSKYKLVNCINAYKCSQYNLIESYCKDLTDSNNYYSNQFNKIKNDSILNLYNLSSEKLAIKQLEFIRTHGNDYYYFWFFRTNVVNVLLKTHQIELYETLNSSFPDKFKKSIEGKNTKELIVGRLFIKIGNKSPNFMAIDYKGNKISSEMYRGKFILLNFWATWCAPCIAEIPTLKKIRNSYSNDKLEMISVSLDSDFKSFKNGIKKHKLDWVNIYNDPSLVNLFGKKPIPSIYLIDPKGILIFSSWEEELDKLNEILTNTISK